MNFKKALIIAFCCLISMNQQKLYSHENVTSSLTTKTAQGIKTETFNSSQVIRITKDDKVTYLDLSPEKEIRIIVQLERPPILFKKTKNALKKSVSLAQITGEQQQIEAEIQSVYSSISQKFKDVTLTTPKIRHHFKNTFNGIALSIPQCMLSSIRKIEGIKQVFIDGEIKAIGYNNTSAYALSKIFRETELTGESVIIGIIDTGIDYTHPALGGGIGKGYKVIGGYDICNQDSDPIDDSGHGTHVAGIAAGNGDDWQGIAPDSKLMAFKVLDEYGNGFDSDVIAGIENAVDPDGDPETDDGVDIINMSLGGEGSPDDPVCQAVNNAVKSGVICVVAAGNDGFMFGYQSILSPGLANSAITVGAANSNSTLFFSSKGPTANNEQIKPDIIAPGEDIKSSVLEWKTEQNSGTSMAAPYIAGAAALLLQAHPNWTPQDIKSVLCGTAKNIAEDVYCQGSGLINFQKAEKTFSTVTPSNLGLGITNHTETYFQVQKYITIKNYNQETQNYQLFLRHALSSQINVTIDRLSLTLGTGESDSVQFSMNLNPQQIPLFDSYPANFEGWIDIVSENDTLAVPFSLLHIPNLKIHFDEFPYSLDIFKRKTKVDDDPNIRFILDKNLELSLNLILGEYFVIAVYKAQDDLYFVIKKVNLQNENTLQISKSEAKYRTGFEILTNMNNEIEWKKTILEFDFTFIGDGFHSSTSQTAWGFNNIYLSHVDSSEYFKIFWQSLVKQKDKEKIYYGCKESNSIKGNQTLLLDDQFMKNLDYQVNLYSRLPDSLNLLNIKLCKFDESQFWDKYQEFTDYEFFLPIDPVNPYRILYYPQKEHTISYLRFELAHTPRGSFSYSTQSLDENIWHTGYLAFYEDKIAVMHGDKVKCYPLSEQNNYFGMGVTPPYPKQHIHVSSNNLEIPFNEFYYQAGDYLIDNTDWDRPYQLYSDSVLIKEGMIGSGKIKLTGDPGPFKAIVNYPEIIKIGDATGNARLTTYFNTTNADFQPPNLTDFRLLSNNTLINPNLKPSNVAAQVQFIDDTDLSQIKIQCKAPAETQWKDLPLVQKDDWTIAEIDEALLTNSVDINLVAQDNSGNITEYALLPAYVNQAATRISDVKITPEIIHPAEDLVIQAKIVDQEGITSATSHFRNSKGEMIASIVLYDDGNHHDLDGGDHIYANQWTTPDTAVDLSVDLEIIDHLSNKQNYSNILRFTTKEIPLLKLVEHEITCKPGKEIGEVEIQNIGEAKASEIEIRIRGQNCQFIKFNRKIDSMLPNETAKVTIPYVDGYSKDGRYYVIEFEMLYNNLKTIDTLRAVIKGTCFGELRVFPNNCEPGEQITIKGEGIDLDNINLIKAFIINPIQNSVVDSFHVTIIETNQYLATVYFQTSWATPKKPSDYKIHLLIQDSLGNIEIDSTSLAFTTKPIPADQNDVLFIANSRSDYDFSIPNIINSMKVIGYSFSYWDTYFRGECDFMMLDKYREKAIIWQPEVFFPTEFEVKYKLKMPDETERYKIKRMLDKGGALFIARTHLAEQIEHYDSDFIKQYLGIKYVKSSDQIKYLINKPSDNILSGIKIKLKENVHVDLIKPLTYSTPILVTENGDVAGIKIIRENFKIIFLSFNFSDIADAESQNLLLAQILKWLRSSTTQMEQDNIAVIPSCFALLPNYPNPFNPETRLKYQLPEAAKVTIRVYDLLGREVITLLDDQLTQAGTHELAWNGRNKAGNIVSSGIYLCRFKAGSYRDVIKMILVK